MHNVFTCMNGHTDLLHKSKLMMLLQRE